MQENRLVKVGAVFAILGTVIGAIGNLAHPREVDYENIIDSTIVVVAETPNWIPLHLALVVAVVFSTMGVGALSRSIGGSGSGISRLGFISILIGGAGLVLNLALDGVAVPTAVEAGESLIAATLITGSNALFAINVIVFFGIGFLLMGLGVAMSNNYPRILGWVAAAGGGLNIAVGAMMSVNGQSVDTTNLFLVGSLLTTVWLFVMAILMFGKGGKEAGA